MNTLPKYVVSSTLTEGSWYPTTILRGDLAESIGELKASPGRKLQVHGSSRLAASLLDAGLVDTLRLVVAPVVLGQGRRLLTGHADVGLELLNQRTMPTGLVIIEYAVTGTAPFAKFDGIDPLS